MHCYCDSLSGDTKTLLHSTPNNTYNDVFKIFKTFLFLRARGNEIKTALIRISFVSFFYQTVNRNLIFCQAICPLKGNKSVPFQNTLTPTVTF